MKSLKLIRKIPTKWIWSCNASALASQGIRLANGVFIPDNKIRRTVYRKGGGNGSWLAKGASGLFGTNVTLTNNFDKRHRMKLRMYEQDYMEHLSVGYG